MDWNDFDTLRKQAAAKGNAKIETLAELACSGDAASMAECELVLIGLGGRSFGQPPAHHQFLANLKKAGLALPGEAHATRRRAARKAK